MEITLTDSNFKIKSDWNDVQTSTFEATFLRIWDEKNEEGVFRYKINMPKEKFLEGNFRLFAQLNIDRVTNRRPPEPILNIQQTVNENGFNFTKINKKELMFHVTYLDIANGRENTGNYIAVNVSPLAYGHSLLLPSLNERLTQLLTLDSLEFAVYTLLSNYNPAFRIGFNSLCGFATVNHLHLHAYYLNQFMLLEYINLDHFAGNCYILDKYPAKGYVFQITKTDEILSIINDILKLTNFLIKKNIAHNLYMTRGLSFERTKHPLSTTERDCIRIYVWARTHSAAIKVFDAFNPALCELFGHLLIKTEQSYDQITEESVAEILRDITDGPFNATKDEVRQLFKHIQQ